MNSSEQFAARIAGFPADLRELLEAELAAGNEIVEMASCFPAQPAGAYAKLAKAISTRPRVKTANLDFYDRNSSIYSGEWTDAKRFFFVLEPPRPPEPEPDMNAIREARNAAAAASTPVHPGISGGGAPDDSSAADREGESRGMASAAPASVVRRFQDSMIIDYDKWHDGVGYDVAVLGEASAAERRTIEVMLLARGARDWRDVEALAALNTPKAQAALKLALERGNAEIRAAVRRHAPELVPTAQKIASLVQALRTADIYGGLSQAIDEVAEFHPPEIIVELFRGVLNRKGAAPVHFAALLMFIYGQTKERFDWKLRPFFLRFDTENRAEREKVFRDLCEKTGVDAGKYLAAS